MKHITNIDLYEAAQDARELAGRLMDRFVQAEYFRHKKGKTMTKDEISARVRSITGIQQKQAKEAVNLVFEAIQDAIVAGDRVEVRGFGVFAPKINAQRAGRNPQTGEAMIIAEQKGVKFKPGKAFKGRLNLT